MASHFNHCVRSQSQNQVKPRKKKKKKKKKQKKKGKKQKTFEDKTSSRFVFYVFNVLYN